MGIAGCRKPQDLNVGDVLFAEKVYHYQGGKSELEVSKARPDFGKPTFELLELGKRERLKEDWKQIIKGELDFEVKAKLGIIASGDEVVEHYDSEVGKRINLHYNDSTVVDMESYGFLNAKDRQGVEFAAVYTGVIRGVSDQLEQGIPSDDRVDPRPKSSKDVASRTAAAFAFWLIYKLMVRMRGRAGITLEDQKKKNLELEAKKIRQGAKPRLEMNGGMSSGHEGQITLNLTNKGELASLKSYRVIEGNLIANEQHLPTEIDKGEQKKILLVTKDRSNSTQANYTIEVEYVDTLEFRYRSVIKGTGATCKIVETIELS